MHMHHHRHGSGVGGISRRHLLMGAAGATAVAATTGLAVSPADGAVSARQEALPLPKPIPGGIDTGAPTVGFIHWFLPGPTDATTPVLGLGGMGLDVEPSTITDFRGFTAYAVLAGTAKASDGETYPVELDIRVMEGTYVAEDGTTQRGAFAFL